jgi:hypothetical protein
MSLTELKLCIEEFYSKNNKDILPKFQKSDNESNFLDFEFNCDGIFPGNSDSALDIIFGKNKSECVDLDKLKHALSNLTKEEFDNEIPVFNYTL